MARRRLIDVLSHIVGRGQVEALLVGEFASDGWRQPGKTLHVKREIDVIDSDRGDGVLLLRFGR